MPRPYIIISLLCFLIFSHTAPSSAEAKLYQRDWMVGLVDALGLSYGLPDQPADSNYLAILSGDRHLRIEAEEHLQPTDPVSVQSFQSFGPFSGQGWLSGVAEKTTVHLRFVLPHAGRYQFAAVVRRSGFIFEIGGHRMPADGESTFVRIDLGEVTLDAGEQEIKVHFPANGALDYVELTAAPLPAIGPLDGWQPDQLLTVETMATTMVQILALYDLLPHTGGTFTLEAEELASLNPSEITDIAHLGQPSGGAWVRAGNAEIALELLFQPPTAAVFDLELLGTADRAVPVALNGRDVASITFPPYLATEQLGTFFLAGQQHHLLLRLPPRSGVDVLLLHERWSRNEDFLRLVGLPAPSPPPQPLLMDHLLALLAALAPPR